MQTSVIRHRVADFLKRFPPFDSLAEPDLLELAGSGRVKFHESDEYVFMQGDAGLQMIWMVQQGRVELLEETDSGGQLRDVLGEGDLLGLECLAGDRRCQTSARTASDVILYGIRASQLERLVSRHPAVRQFLAAHVSAAGHGLGRTSWLDADPPPADFLRARLAVLTPDATKREAATRLSEARNGIVAVVHGDGRLAATLTPLDLCMAESVAEIAAAGLILPAASAGVTTREAVREMLRSRCPAVAITSGGTREGRLEAILTAPELALFCGHDPAGTVNAIRRAASSDELAPLLARARRMVLDGLARPQDVEDCCRIETEVAGALTETCFRLAHKCVIEAGIDLPGVPCCWVSFGGFARGDKLEPGLPMIAAIYNDDAAGFRTEDSIYFAAIAGEAMAWFHACGIAATGEPWPEGAHQSMPLSEWTRLYRETIRDPLENGLYARRELFDLRRLFGDEAILRTLRERIALELRDHGTAIPLLANDTLAHLPPLTFFHGLVLDLDGAERESFDVGATAISPIADAARVYAMAWGRLDAANTFDRLEAAAADFPEAGEVLREAADAFRVALYYQATASGRIEPGKLGKLDQRILKTALSSIHRLLEFTADRFIASA